jgi:hypothetical protein
MASTDPPASSGTELTKDSISALEYITQQEELGIQDWEVADIQSRPRGTSFRTRSDNAPRR